jgi:hypothetical protein
MLREAERPVNPGRLTLVLKSPRQASITVVTGRKEQPGDN